VVGGADPGQPRPHDQDIDVFGHRAARSRFSSTASTS
jgi:hypothetical protein